MAAQSAPVTTHASFDESVMPGNREETVPPTSVPVETRRRRTLPGDLLDGQDAEGDEFLRTGEDGAMCLVSRRLRSDTVDQRPLLPSRPAIVPFLRRVPLLASLDTEQLTMVSAFVVTRQVARGELVTLEGQPTEALYIVASGSFKRFKTSRKGREQILHLLTCGDSFGEVSLLDDGDDFASTQALEQGTLYALPRYWFDSLLDEVPDFAHELNRFLAGQVRHITGLVEDLSFRHVMERVAKFVLEQSGDPSRPRLTQLDMAWVTGTTREVVSRALYDLECQGTITVNRGRISVCDPARLQHIAGNHVE